MNILNADVNDDKLTQQWRSQCPAVLISGLHVSGPVRDVIQPRQLDLADFDRVFGPVVQFSCPGRLMRSHPLGCSSRRFPGKS